jgi:hypothetical protein
MGASAALWHKIQKIHLSPGKDQPNSKVLLAKKGGETENEDREIHHVSGRRCSRRGGLP